MFHERGERAAEERQEAADAASILSGLRHSVDSGDLPVEEEDCEHDDEVDTYGNNPDARLMVFGRT
jgi:hypothetical protein